MGYIFIDIEKLNWVRHSRFERRGGDIKQKGLDLSARIRKDYHIRAGKSSPCVV